MFSQQKENLEEDRREVIAIAVRIEGERNV